MPVSRFIMVGGFLGAGKTTALLRLAEHFRERGLRVGLITNDQSVGLVDTTMLSNHDFPVEEITGGCFCCRFNSLTDAAEKLSAVERPDLFLAEPVGSCTDLTATVSYPLRRIFGDGFSVAPFSVLVDPVRAERMLGLAKGNSFSPKVIYIFRKQLEEADVIVINKIETMTPERQSTLTAALKKEFPKAQIVGISARKSTNLDAWLNLIEKADQPGGATMEVDYDTYAEGEALLGWVNFTATVSSVAPFDGNRLLTDYLRELQDELSGAEVEIAHLKATLTPDTGSDLAVMNLVRTEGEAEASHSLQEPIEVGELIVNLRAEADPEILKLLARDTLESLTADRNIDLEMIHVEAFRPGRPVPTHRDLEG